MKKPKLTLNSSTAPAALISAAIIQYIGASLAIGLFAAAPVGAVAWGRIAGAAIILLIWRRPHLDLHRIWMPIVFGLALTGMNVVFYFALSRIPLGAAVALEYIGPVLLSAFTGRNWRVRLGILLALLGVFLISWVGVDISQSSICLGVLFALAAGVGWSVYIVIGRRFSLDGSSIEMLAWGNLTGAIFFFPLAIPGFYPIITNPHLLGIMVLVALFSSVVPYILELRVMGVVPTAVYSLLSSLYPATSLLVGVVMLRQIPTWGEILGLLCVSLAVALVTVPSNKK
ncbi:DMT family transporter [uncultured Arcanobacterium sp.]|uniref:EamA family transporter n=1 Tax=uncultured Arcanobacterium sp. TaxID=487520 RepID=UPI00261543A0|nr:EamA family transporter [uncultured Arcanobacterium sp.]